MNDVREEVYNWENIKNGFAEKAESFNIVWISKKVFSFKILLVINEIIGYSIKFIFINSTIFFSPRKLNGSFTNKFESFSIFFRNL